MPRLGNEEPGGKEEMYFRCHPSTAHDKTVNRCRRTPRRVTGSGLRLPGREDRGFQYVCVLPGYNATSGIGVKCYSKN